MSKNGNGNSVTIIGSIRHKNKRVNIPTELRDFETGQELAPKIISHPRDQSLDPQLVWKGKDEQDRENLAVPVIPIYIQEKIHPQAIPDCPASNSPTTIRPTFSPTLMVARWSSTRR